MSTLVSILMLMSMVTSLQGHSYIFGTSCETVRDNVTERSVPNIHKGENLDLFKGGLERTRMYAPPMARPAEDWGGCATASPYVGSRLDQPTNQLPPIQIHINHSPGWERWVGWGGRLLKQGQAVAISGWYSSCWPVIHTHSNPARLIIECRGITITFCIFFPISDGLLYLHPHVHTIDLYFFKNTFNYLFVKLRSKWIMENICFNSVIEILLSLHSKIF